MGFWSGVLKQLGQQEHDDRITQIKQASDMAKQLHDYFAERSQDPNEIPESQQEYTDRLAQVWQIDPTKPNALKKLQDLANIPAMIESKTRMAPGKPVRPAASVKVPPTTLQTTPPDMSSVSKALTGMPSAPMQPSEVQGAKARTADIPESAEKGPPTEEQVAPYLRPRRKTTSELELEKLHAMAGTKALEMQTALDLARAKMPIEVETAEAIEALKPPEHVNTPRGSITTILGRKGQTLNTIEGREYEPPKAKLQKAELVGPNGGRFAGYFNPDPDAPYRYWHDAPDGTMQPVPNAQLYHAPPTVLVNTVGSGGTPIIKIVPKTAGSEFAAAPTAGEKEREAARKRVIPGVNALEAMSKKLISKTGIAQRATAVGRGISAAFGADPEYRTYNDARTALAGNLATAQQGSRISDTDVKAMWLPMIPSVFNDTSESIVLKWQIIRLMASLPPEPTEDNGPPMWAREALATGQVAPSAPPNMPSDNRPTPADFAENPNMDLKDPDTGTVWYLDKGTVKERKNASR